MCDSMFVSYTRKSSYLSCCIPSKFRKYKACDYQTSNAFVKFLICFHRFSFPFFFLASMDDDSLMCKRLTYVNRFFVIAQALDGTPPFPFWPQTLYTSGADTKRMRTAYYCLQHYFYICAPRLFGHSSNNYYVELGCKSIL